MDVNPYEAPQQDSYKPNPKTVLVLRMLAVITWTACLAVIAFFFTVFAISEDFGRRRGLSTNFLIGFVVAIGLPTIGTALIGLAFWLRSWPFAFLGIAAFAPLAYLMIALTIINAR